MTSTNTPDPADIPPGQVWAIDPPDWSDGDWIACRTDWGEWKATYAGSPVVSIWFSDSGIRLRHRLVGQHGLTQDHIDTLMQPWISVMGDPR